MKIILSFLIVVVCMVSLSSCYYDKEEYLYGNSNAPCNDTTGAVSYSQKVKPLLQQYCYSCHSGSFPSGNILMGTYSSDKAIAQNGKLYGCINHSSGYVPMPEGMPKMGNCQIGVIKKWIDSGVPNN